MKIESVLDNVKQKKNHIQVIFTLLAGFWPEGGKMIKVLPANFNKNFADTFGASLLLLLPTCALI